MPIENGELVGTPTRTLTVQAASQTTGTEPSAEFKRNVSSGSLGVNVTRTVPGAAVPSSAFVWLTSRAAEDRAEAAGGMPRSSARMHGAALDTARLASKEMIARPRRWLISMPFTRFGLIASFEDPTHRVQA